MIKITNLRKSYGRFSLHIENMTIPGEKICGLIGANGCGKSTTVKLLAGLISQDSNNSAIDYGKLSQKDITLIPQKPYIMRDTVLANLMYPLKLRKTKPDMELIDHFLELAGLQDLKQAYAPSLSSGEGQKLALIRAMVFSPKVIFVDETFSNMDMKSHANFEKYIVERQKKHPVTWVVITHQLATIKRMCEYIFFMDDGRIEEEGKIEEVFSAPKTPTLERFLELNHLNKD